MTKLRECPLCQSRAEILSERDGEYIVCTNPECALRLTIGDREVGVMRWNMRPKETK